MNLQPTHDHLSYSQINCYTSCPLKYRFHYIDGLEPEFTSSALMFGSAMHEGIQAYLQSCLEAEPLRPDQILDVYRSEWLGCSGPSIRYARGESEDGLLGKAKDLFAIFVDQHDPQSEVIAVEEEFTMDLNKLTADSPIPLPPLTGFIDAVIQTNGSTGLIDYKTTSRKPSGGVNPMQLAAYSLGATTLGYDPNELDYRFEYLVKSKPELVSYPVQVDDRDRQRFLKTITRVWKAINSSIFYPVTSHLCGSCGYQRCCKEW